MGFPYEFDSHRPHHLESKGLIPENGVKPFFDSGLFCIFSGKLGLSRQLIATLAFDYKAKKTIAQCRKQKVKVSK